MALSETVEEYLEKLYWFDEAGIEPTQANLARAMQVSQPTVTEMVRRLEEEGLIARDARKRIRFTEHGEEVAQHIVNRHRLIEAYLVREFDIPWDEVHEEAHSFEHAISANLERRMWAKLTDVRTCPHGHPIGDFPREPGELLASVPVGSAVRVLRLENEDPEILRLLKRSGVEPGDTIRAAGLDSDALRIETGAGAHALPLGVAQSVSVAVVERGDGPSAELADLDAAAMLSGTDWGR